MPLDRSRAPEHFAWEKLRELVVVPIIAYRGEVPPSGRKITVTHPYYSWWWIDQGSVGLRSGSQCYDVPVGSWILWPSGLQRQQHFASGTRILSINFDARWARGASLLAMSGPWIGKRHTVAKLLLRAESVIKALPSNWDPREPSLRFREFSLYDALEIRAAVQRFVGTLFAAAVEQGGMQLAQETVQDERLETILSHLRGHLKAGPLPYKQWQRQTGLSRAQMDRLARTHLHHSLRHHRDKLLLSEASRQMSESLAPVKQIAAELGFVDTAHFCRWIRHHTGHAPGDLRRTGA